MKILVDEMYDGLDEKLKKEGYSEVQSVKKLINEGEKMASDFSVLTHAKENDMILITADVENKKGCDENGIKCITHGQNSLLDYALKELEKFKK